MVSICIHADPNRSKPIAIVAPSESALSLFAAGKGLASTNTSLESLVENPKVVEAMLAELLSVGKRGGLIGMELIQGLVLVPEEWTAENVHPIVREVLILVIADWRLEIEPEIYFGKV